MAYKYYTAGSSVVAKPPSEQILFDLQSLLTSQFSLSPTYYTIQQEAFLGSGSMVDLGARVISAVDGATGEKLGDDYKRIIFENLSHVTGVGWKYYFDNNWWLATNTEVIKSIGVAITARRCNNQLRWIDNNGNVYSEPCIIDYEISANRNYTRGELVTPQGDTHVVCQFNSRTNTIVKDRRFLFGNSQNWTAFRIDGGGNRNFLNQQTENNNSPGVIKFTMTAYQQNTEDVDNLTLGIANYYDYQYQLSVTPDTIEGNVGSMYQLNTLLTMGGGDPISRPLTYSTSASGVVSTSASGLLTLVSTGSAVITACMTNNENVCEDVVVTVSATPIVESEIRVSPNVDYVAQGDTQTYTVYLYEEGVLQPDIFIFGADVTNVVPGNYYTLTTIDDNSFSLKNNEMYLSSPLIINCSSGSQTKVLNIWLKGAW